MEDSRQKANVDRFIMNRIDTVPHLEALLLLWRERPQSWAPESVAKRLWVKPEVARDILQDLARDQLLAVSPQPGQYVYSSDPETDLLLSALNDTYRQEMIRISNMIHSKASSAVREFARAFRIKKEQE